MKINHSIQVDLANPGLPSRLQATQDDSVSHVLALHLKESGKAWPIPADAAVLVQFRKSDRTGGVYDTLPDGSAVMLPRNDYSWKVMRSSCAEDEVEKLPEWVKQFYRIRCEADGIIFPPKRITDESVVLLEKTEK